MKKIAMLGLVGLIAAGVPQANAQKPKQQKVEGRVVLPAPFADGTSCFAGLHRRIAIMSQESVNGDFGYHFDIDPATAGKPFVLEATGGLGTVDLDILFYTKFGTPEDVVNDPAGAGAPPSITFGTREAGGESGKVPPAEYTKAIVCLYGGTGGAGANATFTYTAGKGVKIKK